MKRSRLPAILPAIVEGPDKRNLFVYGRVGYQRSFDGDARAWDGKLGLRVNW